MSAAAVFSLLNDNCTRNTCSVRRSSTMERRESLLGSLRNKFSRSSTKEAPARVRSFKSALTSCERTTDNPYSQTSAPTRRPDRPGMNAFTTPATQPSPAYTPMLDARAKPNASIPPVPADGCYAFLSSFDTVFLIDDSGSMAGRSWPETFRVLKANTPTCDLDSLDIHCFLNRPDNPYSHNRHPPSTVMDILSTVRSQGGITSGQRLNQILKPYLQRATMSTDDTKLLNMVIMKDEDDMEHMKINAMKKLDGYDTPGWQLGTRKEHLKHMRPNDATLAEQKTGPNTGYNIGFKQVLTRLTLLLILAPMLPVAGAYPGQRQVQEARKNCVDLFFFVATPLVVAYGNRRIISGALMGTSCFVWLTAQKDSWMPAAATWSLYALWLLSAIVFISDVCLSTRDRRWYMIGMVTLTFYLMTLSSGLRMLKDEDFVTLLPPFVSLAAVLVSLPFKGRRKMHSQTIEGESV